MKKINWLLCFTVLQILTMVILLTAVVNENKEYTLAFQIASIITCIISYAALFMLYRDIMKKAQLEADNELLKKQIAIQKEHYVALSENQKQMQAVKEELLQKMNVAHPEAFDDEASTRAYINELIAKSDRIQELDYCQNKVIDAILYHKFLIAHASKIKTESEFIVPQELNIDGLDLMRLLTNLLDNAIEACDHVEEEKRYLRIQGHMRAEYLVLQVENSKCSTKIVDYDNPASTKKDKEEHGLGIHIIKEIVRKYHGSLSAEDHETSFVVNITLQTSPSSNNHRFHLSQKR